MSKISDFKSVVFWFTGLSGAGKTTLTRYIREKFFDYTDTAIVLDGDIIRKGINSDLGFSMQDRLENTRRIAEIAKFLSSNNIICLCACITPQENMRSLARSIIGNGYYEIYVKCPLDVCRGRDVKGNYKLAYDGAIPDYTGVGSSFEEPKNPDLIVDTANSSIQECALQVYNFIKNKIQ